MSVLAQRIANLLDDSMDTVKADLSLPKWVKAILGAVFGRAANLDRTEKEIKVSIGLNRV